VNKLTMEFVKKEFEKENYKLISNYYINSKTKLDYICPKGHKSSISWNSWQQGHRCCFCCKYRNKYTIKDIKREFEKEKYVLLSNKYINNKQKLNYICSNGHKCSICWSDWQQGKRCMLCFRKNNSGENHHNYGKKFSDKHRKNLAKARKGQKHTKKTIQKISESLKGRIFSKEHRNKISKSQIGNSNSMYGKHGSLNPNWKGGISCEPYCFEWSSKEFKDYIKERDDYKCLNPYCCSKNPNDLTIHHIDYNKKNCDPSNLITLCVSCNSRANKDRKWHKAWYQAIMYRRYIT